MSDQSQGWTSTADHSAPPASTSSAGGWSSTADHVDAPKDQGFWKTLGGDIAALPGRAWDFAGSMLTHPIDKLTEIGTGLTQGREQAQAQAVEAYKKGNYKEAAEHALGAFPVIGPGFNQIANELRQPEQGQAPDETHQGKTGEGGAHLVEALAPMAIPALAETPAGKAVGTAVKTAARSAAPAAAAGVEATGAGLRAAAPDLAGAAAKYVGGEVVGSLPGASMKYAAARQAVKGLTKGYQAGKATLQERLASALAPDTAAAAAPVGPPPVQPAGLITQGDVIPPAPPDGSFVRSVPGEYATVERPPAAAAPAPPAPAPRALLPAGPAVRPMPAAADASYVRSVPLEEINPAMAEQAATPAAAQAPAAAAGDSPEMAKLLNDIAVPNYGGPFAKLSPERQVIVRNLANRLMGGPVEAPPPRPAAPAAPRPAPTPAPAPPPEAVAPPPAPEPALAPTPAAAAPAPAIEPEPSAAPPAIDRPQSQFDANGDRKSPQLRGQEIRITKTQAKGDLFAGALHKAYGNSVGSEDLGNIPFRRATADDIAKGAVPGWPNIVDDLIAKGHLPAGTTPPRTSIPRMTFALRQLEAQASQAAAAAPEAVSQALGPVAK